MKRLLIGGATAALIVVFAGPGQRASAQAPAPPVKQVAPVTVEPKAAKETPPGGEQKIEEVEQATKRFRAGDFDGAKALLDKAVQAHPELPPARVILASWFSQIQQTAMVYTQLEAAVVELPEDPEPYRLLGDLAGQSGRWAEADLCYRKAAEMLPGFQGNSKRKDQLERRVLLGQADVAEARKDWPGTQKSVEAILALEPKNSGLLQRVAHAIFMQKKPDEALARLKQAAAADPNLLTAEAMLGSFYHQEGDEENAGKWMTEAIKVSPKEVSTRIVAADWALGTSQFKTAQQQIEAALQLDPNHADAQLLRGILAMFQKDYPVAVEYFQKVVNQSPGHAQAMTNLILALAEQDDTARQKAHELARAHLQKAPNQPDSYAALGWVLFKLGRTDEAEPALRKALELSQAQNQRVKSDTLYYVAQVAVYRKRMDEARQALEMALRSKTPFAKQSDATELLKELSRTTSRPLGVKPAAPAGQKPASGGK
jgi:tetratricopeptide (TPR) repeat protein